GFRRALANLDKRSDGRVVAAVFRSSALSLEDLRDREKVKAAAAALDEYLKAHHTEMQPVKVEIGWDAEHDTGRIEVIPSSVSARRSTIDYDLVEAPEYQEALAAQHDLLSIGKPPYLARTDKGETELPSAEALTEFLEERGRRGVMVNRYKGLGEMNADELWDTTM